MKHNGFVYDLCDLESAGFSVVANQLFKYINFNWSRSEALIIYVVAISFFLLRPNFLFRVRVSNSFNILLFNSVWVIETKHISVAQVRLVSNQQVFVLCGELRIKQKQIQIYWKLSSIYSGRVSEVKKK